MSKNKSNQPDKTSLDSQLNDILSDSHIPVTEEEIHNHERGFTLDTDFSAIEHRHLDDAPVATLTEPVKVVSFESTIAQSISSFQDKSFLFSLPWLLDRWKNALPEEYNLPQYINHLEELSHVFSGIDSQQGESVGYEDLNKLLYDISDSSSAIPKAYYVYDKDLADRKYFNSVYIHFGEKIYTLHLERDNEAVLINSGVLSRQDGKPKFVPDHFIGINYIKNIGEVSAYLTLNPQGLEDVQSAELDYISSFFKVTPKENKAESARLSKCRNIREKSSVVSKFKLDGTRHIIDNLVGEIDLEKEPYLDWAKKLLEEALEDVPTKFSAGVTLHCSDYDKDKLLLDKSFEESADKYGVLHKLLVLTPQLQEVVSYVCFTQNGCLEFTFKEDTKSESPSRTMEMTIIHIELDDKSVYVAKKGSISVREFKYLSNREVNVTKLPGPKDPSNAKESVGFNID